MKTNKTKDPVSVLENQDARQRQDFTRAARFVVKSLSGERLREFVTQATALLRRFSPKTDSIPGGEGAQRS